MFIVALLVSLISLGNPGDYDQQLCQGESAEFEFKPKSLVLLHNYPKFTNKVQEGKIVEENISQHYFKEEGKLMLQAKMNAIAHLSVIQLNEEDCDETLVSTKFETNYDISDTMYQEGEPVASFIDGKKICFVTTAPHYFNYAIDIKSNIHIDTQSINGTLYNIEDNAELTSKSVFLRWTSSSKVNFSIKSVPTTKLVGYDSGETYFFRNNNLLRGVTVAKNGNYIYKGTYPMTFSVASLGYIVMQNSKSGGLVYDFLNVNEGPEKLYFAFLPSSEVEMCDSISFSLDKNQYVVAPRGNATFDITTVKCVYFSSPHTIDYSVYTNNTSSYVEAYYESKLVATTRNENRKFTVEHNPCLFILHITSTEARNAKIVITPSITVPVFIDNINAGKAHLVSNVFKYEQITDVEINAVSGDYEIPMKTGNSFILLAKSEVYILFHNTKSFNAEIYIENRNKGKINFINNYGVQLYNKGYLNISCTSDETLYMSIFEFVGRYSNCHSLYTTTGSTLQFTVAQKRSVEFERSNITYETDIVACAWLASPFKTNYTLESSGMTLNKDHINVFELRSNDEIGSLTGIPYIKKELPGEKSVITEFISSNSDNIDGSYAKITAKATMKDSFLQSKLGFKNADGFRWITTDSDATVKTNYNKKEKKVDLTVIISVSCVGVIFLCSFLIAFIFTKKSRRRSQVTNSSSEQDDQPEAIVFTPDSPPTIISLEDNEPHQSVYEVSSESNNNSSDINPYEDNAGLIL